MKKFFKNTLPFCIITAICASGCAKHEMVKTDQMIPAPVATKPVLKSNAAKEADAKAADETAAREAAAREAAAKEAAAREAAAREAAARENAALAKVQTDTVDANLQQVLEKIYFDFDSYTLSPAAREALTKNAEVLKRKGAVHVRIEGNCDELGSDEYNLALGERRANAAMNYLSTLGLRSIHFSTISYGKEKPADPGHDEAARARNRRDELVILSN